MRQTESFLILVKQMELDASTRVFQQRKMRPPSPNGTDEQLDWSIVAGRQVDLMLCKSRVMNRRFLKKNIINIIQNMKLKFPVVKASMQTFDFDYDKEEEVSTILADMTSFMKTTS